MKTFLKVCRKAVRALSAVCEFAVGLYEKTVDIIDRVVHRRDYLARERRRTLAKVILGSLAVILLCPYRIVFRKDGTFDVRSILVGISGRIIPAAENKTEDEPAEVTG